MTREQFAHVLRTVSQLTRLPGTRRRTLTMTTWIMQNIGESAAAADEFALRVGSLRERDFERAWNFF
jgi:hypothetical protein